MKPSDDRIAMGNMLVTELDDPDQLAIQCGKCNHKFIFSDNPKRLCNHYYRPDFSITAQCPACKMVWEPSDDLDELDETLLFLVSIDYTIVSPNGKKLIEKRHEFPSSRQPMLAVIMETFAKSGDTCRITAINIRTITLDEYKEARLQILNKVQNTMHKLFTSLFGEPDNDNES